MVFPTPPLCYTMFVVQNAGVPKEVRHLFIWVNVVLLQLPFG